MDTERLLHLLDAGDHDAWAPLARALERRADAQSAAQALTSLFAQGQVVEAAQWLARIADAPAHQGLKASLLALSRGWTPGTRLAVTQGLLGGSFRLIPAGGFWMGSGEGEERRYADEARHWVELTWPFLLKTAPVTQAEWLAVMGDNPAHFLGDDRRPVEQVSWEDAARLCDAFRARLGGLYRLPTEAEWEYACRAGSDAPRHGDLDAIGWHWKTAGLTTQPVTQKQPNAWGLHDMLGNVWEWCHDWYDAYPDATPSAPSRDPSGPAHGEGRVIRGGTWNSFARYCRAAQRSDSPPGARLNTIGLRLACSLG